MKELKKRTVENSWLGSVIFFFSRPVRVRTLGEKDNLNDKTAYSLNEIILALDFGPKHWLKSNTRMCSLLYVLRMLEGDSVFFSLFDGTHTRIKYSNLMFLFLVFFFCVAFND